MDEPPPRAPHEDGHRPAARAFSDPAAVASYVERTRRAVPGLEVLHDLADRLLDEAVPRDGRVLVVGAGGGLELRHFAAHHPDWRLDGVDPSGEMLDLARTTLGAHAERAALHEGVVDDAPEGPFDGATCLLTLHFLPAAERLATLRGIRRRLRPGAPLLTVHHSVPAGPARDAWLARYARYAAAPGADPERIAASAAALGAHLPLLAPEEDEELLRRAGFRTPARFYAALTLQGWLAHADGAP